MRGPESNSGNAVRTALITGASAGIGRAFAEVFAENGFDVVLVARREERLRMLAVEVAERYGVAAHVLAADLADPASPQMIYDQVVRERVNVDALVNNAGYGLPQDYTETSWADQAAFLQVTTTAVAHLIHLFLPGMIERRYGRIINVSSLAALMPGMPGFTLYSGAKSFLVKTSQSLTIELKGTGVHATTVCPGFTYSEFHDVTKTRKDVSRLPRFMWMTSEEVARESYRAAMTGKPLHVNGRLNRFFARLARHLPDRLMMKASPRQIVDRS
jgi:short-subunit dehydrogenase